LKSGSDSHFILTHGQQVFLSAPEKLRIDVEAFEQAATEALKGSDTLPYERALALYEGDLLIEDPYEDWVMMRREHLRALRQDLLARLSRIYEARGEHQQAIAQLKQIVALEPSNEGAHRQLMRLYALTGNRQQALYQYQQCCDDLMRELDSQPEQDTVKLYEQVVSGVIKHSQAHSGADQTIDSIAILPLANVSTDPDTEYFSDGITESIINNLSQLPQLKVIARSTIFRYKGQQVDLQEVGSRLGVRAVMTGRVILRQDNLNIQIELVEVSEGAQIWGEQYNRTISDILALQEEIAREITEKLRLRLSRGEKQRLVKRYTENIKAYRLYLQGRYHLLSQYTEEGWKKATGYIEEAINEDPSYALAIAGLSYCYLFASNLFLPPKEAKAIAEGLARKALEIDDTLAEAHISLAIIAFAHHWNWAGAEREIIRAIELKPKFADARWVYGMYLASLGRLDEGLAEIMQAQELDPLSLPISIDVGWIYYLSHRYTEAREQLQKALEIDPKNPETIVYLARTYVATRDYSLAIAILENASQSDETQWLLAMLGYVRAVSGRGDEARQIIEQLKEMSGARYVSPMHIALIFAGLNEKDQAILWLEKAYEERADMLSSLGVDPVFDNLRSDARFLDLVRRIGLIP
jgi:TolB-like protein/Tfp pilus assembly protein PilF